jgi:cytochrome b
MSDAGHVMKTAEKVRAWDLPTRLFHWLLVLSLVAAWATWRYSEALGDPTLSYHRWC